MASQDRVSPPRIRLSPALHFMVGYSSNKRVIELMGFQEQYRLLEVLADREAKVHRALQLATGKKVLVHQIFGERTPAGCTGLVTLIFQKSLAPAQRAKTPFLDMGDYEGHIYVVTEDAEPFLDLRAWVSAYAVKAPGVARPAETKSPATEQPSVVSATQPAASGSMTHFFSPKEILAKSPPAQPSSEVPGEAPTTPSLPDQQTPAATPPGGEFEKLFARRGPTATPPSKPEAPPEPPVSAQPPASPASQQPGEFTRRFSGMGAAKLGEPPQSAARPLPPATPPAVDKPPAAPSQPLAVPPSPAAPQAASGPPREPGEFTQMFIRGAKPAAPSGPAVTPAPPPKPAATPPQPPSVPPSPAPTQAASGAPREPGEFTQMFIRGAKPAAPSGPAVTPAPLPKPAAAPPQPPSVPPGPAPTQPASGDQQEPGSFTQMFFGGTRPTPSPGVSRAGKPGAPGMPSEKPAPSATPEGFEVVFRSRKQQGAEPPAPGKEAPPPAAQPPQGPGEFTQMFHGKPAQPAAPPTAVLRETPQPPAPVPPAPPAPGGPGEFTRMFSAQVPQKTVEDAIRPGPPHQVATPFSAPSTPAKEPGEFTQMFRAGSVAGTPPERPVAPVPSDLRSSSPAAQQAPGEFTAIMGGYRAPRPTGPAEPFSPVPPTPAVPAPTGGPGQAGEFTAMFQTPPKPSMAPPVSPSPPSPPPPPAPVEPAAPSGPGEYTRIISGRPIQPAAGQPSASPAGAPGAPRVAVSVQPMQMPVMPAVQMQQPVAPVPPQMYVQPGQIQAGPGGVSMQAPQVSPVMPTVPGQFAPSMQAPNIAMGVPQASAAPAPSPKKRSLLPLIIILGSVFVVTLGLILYFALRH